MLKYGAPGEDPNRPKTWMELVGYPLILALLFVASFHLFLKYVPARTTPKFTLPINRGKAGGLPPHLAAEQRVQQHRQRQQQQQGDAAGDRPGEEL